MVRTCREVAMSKAYAVGASFKGVDFSNAVLDRVNLRNQIFKVLCSRTLYYQNLHSTMPSFRMQFLTTRSSAILIFRGFTPIRPSVKKGELLLDVGSTYGKLSVGIIPHTIVKNKF